MKHERRNFYRILHLQPDAPTEIVHSNYRTLMHKLRMHPDLGGDHWNAAQLGEAYTVLSDPEKRRAYDAELLAVYDLATLSQGRSGARRKRGRHRRRLGNRRNYYRLLEVQRDAPQEIVDASLLSLRESGLLDERLLADAEAILCDPARRVIYGDALADHGHAEAAGLALGESEAASDPRAAGDTEARITAFCAFCKTPHAPAALGRCEDCASPLAAPDEALASLARRVVARFERSETVDVYGYWPGRATHARLVDLSPTGLRMATGLRVDADDCLKIDGDDFRAVGSVAHQAREGRSNVVGLRFVAVEFRRARGSFVRTSA